jgi:hypothetical protein
MLNGTEYLLYYKNGTRQGGLGWALMEEKYQEDKS